MRWIVVALGLLAACGKKAETCAKEANAIGAMLAGANTAPSAVYVPGDLRLVVRADLPGVELRHAPTVALRAGVIEYEGAVMSGPAAFAERLAATQAAMAAAADLGERHPDPPDPARYHLLIDEATPWPQVVTAVEAATRAGMTAPVFVFAAPETATPPPRAEIDPKIDEIMTAGAADKATRLARLIEDEVRNCSSVVDLFGQMASEATVPRDQHLVNNIGKALIGCECNVDMANLRSLLWRLLVTPPIRAIAFTPGAAAERIAAPATVTWNVVAPKLAPSLANATFAVE